MSPVLLYACTYMPRSCGCPVLESVQGWAEKGFEQPHLVSNISAHGEGKVI